MCSVLSLIALCFHLQFLPFGGFFQTVLVVGNGIVNTIQDWGKLLNVYGSDEVRSKDFSVNYLG